MLKRLVYDSGACRCRQLPLQFVGQPEVVGVEERDPRARGQRDPGVARLRDAGVGLAEHADAIAELIEACRGAIGRAVVDDDHLDVLIGLLQRRSNGLQR